MPNDFAQAGLQALRSSYFTSTYLVTLGGQAPKPETRRSQTHNINLGLLGNAAGTLCNDALPCSACSWPCGTRFSKLLSWGSDLGINEDKMKLMLGAGTYAPV